MPYQIIVLRSIFFSIFFCLNTISRHCIIWLKCLNFFDSQYQIYTYNSLPLQDIYPSFWFPRTRIMTWHWRHPVQKLPYMYATWINYSFFMSQWPESIWLLSFTHPNKNIKIKQRQNSLFIHSWKVENLMGSNLLRSLEEAENCVHPDGKR